MLNEHLRRRPDATAPVDPNMRILDFGCGVDLWDNLAIMTNSEIYPVRHNVLLVSGTIGRVLSDRYFGTDAPYPNGEKISH